MTRGVDHGLHDDLNAAVSNLVSRAGFDLEDVTVRLTGSRRLIRVVVDRDGGVGLDDAAAVSRDIAAALDTEYDGILGDEPYTLEVTSRGVGAPLTEPRHFRRAVGRLVTIVRTDSSAITVRVARVDATELVVLSGSDGTATVTIPLGDIRSAKVEPEFTAPSSHVTALLRALGGAPAADMGDATTGRIATHDEGEDAR